MRHRRILPEGGERRAGGRGDAPHDHRPRLPGAGLHRPRALRRRPQLGIGCAGQAGGAGGARTPRPRPSSMRSRHRRRSATPPSHDGVLRVELGNGAAAAAVERAVLRSAPGSEVFSIGRRLDLVKRVGTAADLDASFRIRGLRGHPRDRPHPALHREPGRPQPLAAVLGPRRPDLATVHNGHITNYLKLRDLYELRGSRFYTENDSEIIRPTSAEQLAQGATLEQALAPSLADLDGTFSYLVATADRARLREGPVRAKPLIMAETDDAVAVATEEIAICGRRAGRRSTPPSCPRGRCAYGRGSRGAAPSTAGADSMREINRALREAVAAGERPSGCSTPRPGTTWRVALLEPVESRIEGSVGYYCGGMRDGATVEIARQRRLGPRRVHAGRHGRRRRQRRQRRGGVDPRRHGRGPRRLRPRGPASSMKGGTAAHRRRRRLHDRLHDAEGPIVICGDAGDALADSMYEGASSSAARSRARQRRRGRGADDRRTTSTCSRAACDGVRAARRPRERSRRSSRAGKLWNFEQHELEMWRARAVSDTDELARPCSGPARSTRPRSSRTSRTRRELGRYRIRGFGTLRPRPLPHFDDLTFLPCGADAHPARGLPRALRRPRPCSARGTPSSRSSSTSRS